MRSVDKLIDVGRKYANWAYNVILSFAKCKISAWEEMEEEKKEVSEQLGQPYFSFLISLKRLTLISSPLTLLMSPPPRLINITSPPRPCLSSPHLSPLGLSQLHLGPLCLSPLRLSLLRLSPPCTPFQLLHSTCIENLLPLLIQLKNLTPPSLNFMSTSSTTSAHLTTAVSTTAGSTITTALVT